MKVSEAVRFIGREVVITWDEPDGSVGSMAGTVEKVYMFHGEPSVLLDWGYGIGVADIKTMCLASEEDPQPNNTVTR